LKTKTRTVKAEQNPWYTTLFRQGNITFEDVGCSSMGQWICSKNGTILKSSATPVKYILSDNINGNCKSIDTDYSGFPWVVTSTGDVYRLQRIVDDSVLFQQVHSAQGSSKAIDIGCGQEKGSTCYIAVENSQYPWVYNGKFIADKELDAQSNILRLDVGSGKTGIEVTVVNEDKFVLHLSRNYAPVSLGIQADDLSIGYNNDLYVANGYGIFFKSKCSKFFNQIHDTLASKISVGVSLWTVGYDNFAYNGTLNSYVDGC
jgi:hypothetical protein